MKVLSAKQHDDAFVLGVDIGGTRVKCAWYHCGTGAHAGSHLFATRDCGVSEGSPAFASDVKAQIALLEQRLKRPFVAVGIAAPGLAATDQRSIACMPGRLEGLTHLDWTELLGRKELVPVLNDAHAALYGEVWQGAAQGLQNVVMLTLGTGVGGAFLCNGKLVTGAIGRAGHLGHVSLNWKGKLDIVGTPGSLEDAIGECTLPHRSRGRFLTTKHLITAVQSGDNEARKIWTQSVEILAAALTSFVNIFDPECLVLGGGISQAGPQLFEPLRARLDEIEWKALGRRVPLHRAALHDWGGACGAARAALLALPSSLSFENKL